MMNTCKTCRWWGDYPLSKDTLLHLVPDEYSEMRFCPKTNLQVWSNYFGEMKCGVMATMPDFGCIHHEPKEKEDE
jgi:hypothetical protein